MHTYLHLFLRGDTVEAAAAGIALHVYDTEAVARVLADALECGECALVDLWLKGLGLGTQCFFLLACLAYDLVEFATFFGEDVFEVGHALVCGVDVGPAVLDGARVVVDVFLGELDLKRLELHLFVEQVIFAVVAHVVHLLVVACDESLARVYLLFLGGYGACQLVNLVREVVDTCVEAGDLVFEVLYFEGKFAAYCLDAVDLR